MTYLNTISPVSLLFMASTAVLMILLIGILVGVSRNRPIIGGGERPYETSGFASFGLLIAGALILTILLSFSDYKLTDMLPEKAKVLAQAATSPVKASIDKPEVKPPPITSKLPVKSAPPPVIIEPTEIACHCLQLNAYDLNSKFADNYREKLRAKGHDARVLNRDGRTKVVICGFKDPAKAKAYGELHGLKNKIVFHDCQ